jgi:hypothetical protein
LALAGFASNGASAGEGDEDSSRAGAALQLSAAPSLAAPGALSS